MNNFQDSCVSVSIHVVDAVAHRFYWHVNPYYLNPTSAMVHSHAGNYQWWFSKWYGSWVVCFILPLQPLDKKIPENPKYKHIKSTLDTGEDICINSAE